MVVIIKLLSVQAAAGLATLALIVGIEMRVDDNCRSLSFFNRVFLVANKVRRTRE